MRETLECVHDAITPNVHFHVCPSFFLYVIPKSDAY